MYIRKLVKSGLSSFVVAVPQDWIKKNKLKKGDLIYLKEKSPEELILSTEFKEDTIEKREIVVNIDNKSQTEIKFEVISAYLNNYYRIILKGKKINKDAAFIKRLTHDLVALETFEENSEKIVLRNFLDLKDVSIKGLIRRIDNITRSMLLDTKLSITGEDLHDVIYARDADVNRLGYLVFKILKTAFSDIQIAKSLDLSNIEMLSYWEANIHIEKVADETKRISRLIHTSKRDRYDRKLLFNLFQKVEKQYVESMTSFYKKDKSLSDHLAIKRISLLKECDLFTGRFKSITVSEFTGKMKGILSRSSDISRMTRYLF